MKIIEYDNVRDMNGNFLFTLKSGMELELFFHRIGKNEDGSFSGLIHFKAVDGKEYAFSYPETLYEIGEDEQ